MTELTVNHAATPRPALLDVDEAAAVLGCSGRLVRKLIAQGELPGLRLGRLVKVRRVDLDNFVAG